MTAAGPVAELVDVHKAYGEVEALRGVSLALAPGETVALLGLNGAGKSTAINLLLGLRRPDRGTVRLLGGDPRTPSVRAGIGATPQETAFPLRLKCREVIELVRRHYPQALPTAHVVERFGLDAFADRQTGGLSGGQRRRLALALAFVGQGRAVFLDEPTTGLDADVRRGLWRVMRDYVAGGGALFLTTHYLEEAQALADRVVLIDHGQVLLSGTVDEIRALVALQRVSLDAAELPALAGVVARQSDGGRHHLLTNDADALVRTLVGQGVPFRDLEVGPLSLEDAVLALLDRRKAGEAGG